MITIKRVGSEVKIVVEYHIPYGTSWASEFSSTYSGEHYAQLVYHRIKDSFDGLICSVRREEYERGWKDAKGHRTKCDWFSSRL